MERLTKKDVFIGNYTNEEVYTIGTDDESVDTAYTGKAIDRLSDLEDKIERGELVEIVRCEHCINHVDMNYHFCRKLRIECPNDSDFYCKYGERSVANE